ncbi:efflux RND transporter periplasmic adaptor subunit [Herbaspirillum autotrophicum]|uniref:efflux RND transporter periplasmic adaptor subunit n=1 Tax=Herbaspirillum autotrophicum TaxID=180195 RepID=UPI00067E4B24|nr:efflux RND transporter periplasmic adaptor subunit [Herbaspirillum autotrophicum]
MKPPFLKRRSTRITLVLLLLLIIVVVVVAKRRAPAAPAVVTAPVSVLEFLPSDIIEVQPGELRQVLPMSGALRALNQVSVKAKVNGEVRAVLVRAGETVQAGQVLIKMDVSEYQAKLDQAKGALVAARGQLDIATKTRNNNQVLMDKGFISRNAFDNAASQFDIAKANVDSAKGALDVAQKALNDTVIKAPIDGMISSRTIEPGEKISTDNKLLEVVDLRQMELEAPVPTADILKVQLGQDVEVNAEGLPQAVHGQVVRINPATQSGSRSIMVYVRIANPQGLLRAGMFAEASLTLQRKSDVLSVPQSAVQNDADGAYVYAIDNGKLQRRKIQPGMRGMNANGNAVEVVAGLQSGARIVKANLGMLNAGVTVRILPVNAAAKSPATAPTSAPAAAPPAQPASKG